VEFQVVTRARQWLLGDNSIESAMSVSKDLPVSSIGIAFGPVDGVLESVGDFSGFAFQCIIRTTAHIRRFLLYRGHGFWWQCRKPSQGSNLSLGLGDRLHEFATLDRPLPLRVWR